MMGLERLKKLIKGQKDKALNNVVEYLLTRTDMSDKYLNEEKDLKGMISYIRSEAKKQAVGGVAMIEDEVVYGWAIHYFDESNKKLGIDKESPKVEAPKVMRKNKSKSEKIEPDVGEQLRLF